MPNGIPQLSTPGFLSPINTLDTLKNIREGNIDQSIQQETKLPNGITEQDLNFLRKLKEQGVPKQEAIKRLTNVKNELSRQVEVKRGVEMKEKTNLENTNKPKDGTLRRVGRAALRTGGKFLREVGEVQQGAQNVISKGVTNIINKAFGTELKAPQAKSAMNDMLDAAEGKRTFTEVLLEQPESTTLANDMNQILTGGVNASLIKALPFTSMAISAAEEDPLLKGYVEWLGENVAFLGETTSELPVLRQYRAQLDDTQKKRWDGLVGGIEVGGLVKAGRSTVKTVSKNPTVKNTVQEVADQILGPTQKQAEFGLNVKALNGLSEVIARRGKVSTYKELLENIGKTKQEVYAPMKKGLEQATKNLEAQGLKGKFKQLTANMILNEMNKISKNTVLPSKLKNKLKDFNQKMGKKGEGLSLVEMVELKQMMNEVLKVFKDTGEVRPGLTKDAFAEMYTEVKQFIENTAERGGFPEVKTINSTYGSLLDAEAMIKRRTGQVIVDKASRGEMSFLQNAATKILEFPVIKQLATKPAQTVAEHLMNNYKSGKVDVVQIQESLPILTERLKRLNVSDNTINQINTNIMETMLNRTETLPLQITQE